MALPIQKFRELVFQLLYSLDMGNPDEDDLISLMMRELSITRKTVREGLEKVKEIQAKTPEIDALIAQHVTEYSFDRIHSVERNILRMGIYEICFAKELPPKVAIAEAMRLGRKFGAPESSSFINAILDSAYKASGEPQA